jgi:recombinational DNA repair ATPase RecF
MLKSLHLRHLGLARELRVEWADRINLIVGDNGLGKTFLLDLAWWALTRTWASPMALPAPGELKESQHQLHRARRNNNRQTHHIDLQPSRTGPLTRRRASDLSCQSQPPITALFYI